MIKKLLKVIRFRNWLKNILIFVPLVFGGILTRQSFEATLTAFASFSLVSSAVYIVNDLMDLENDRTHPVKCKRPIASGKISHGQGLFLSLFCMTLGTVILTIGGGVHAEKHSPA